MLWTNIIYLPHLISFFLLTKRGELPWNECRLKISWRFKKCSKKPEESETGFLQKNFSRANTLTTPLQRRMPLKLPTGRSYRIVAESPIAEYGQAIQRFRQASLREQADRGACPVQVWLCRKGQAMAGERDSECGFRVYGGQSCQK